MASRRLSARLLSSRCTSVTAAGSAAEAAVVGDSGTVTVFTAMAASHSAAIRTTTAMEMSPMATAIHRQSGHPARPVDLAVVGVADAAGVVAASVLRNPPASK